MSVCNTVVIVSPVMGPQSPWYALQVAQGLEDEGAYPSHHNEQRHLHCLLEGHVVSLYIMDGTL